MARKAAILFRLAIALLLILHITDTFAGYAFKEKMIFKRDAYHNEETSVSYPSSDSYTVYEHEAPEYTAPSYEHPSVNYPPSSDSYTAHEYDAPEYTLPSHEYLSVNHPSSDSYSAHEYEAPEYKDEYLPVSHPSSDAYSVNEYEAPDYTVPSHEYEYPEPNYPQETTTYNTPAEDGVEYNQEVYPGVASQYPLEDLVAQEESYLSQGQGYSGSLSPYQIALVNLLLKSASDYSPPPYDSPYVPAPYATPPSPPQVYGQYPVYQQPRRVPYTPQPQPNYQSRPSYINSQSRYHPIQSY